MRTAQRAVSKKKNVFPLSSRRTPLSKRLKQAKAQRTSVDVGGYRMPVSILKVCLYLKHAIKKRSEKKEHFNLLTGPKFFHRGGLRELTELLRKEKKTRLVWARNYKFKPVFSTTFCTKHVNKKLVNENCSKLLGNGKKEQARSIYSVSCLFNKSLRIASCSMSGHSK